MAVSGDVVYLADGDHGLRMLLVSRSGAAEVGHFLPERRRFEARAVAVAGRFAYLAAGYSGMSVLNISDPRNPVEVAHVDIPLSARSIEVSGSRAYVGDRRGVTVFDISDPSAPRKVDHEAMPASADGLSISDSKLYVAAREAGMMILGTQNAPSADSP